MSGTDFRVSHREPKIRCLRSCYAMSGTDLAYGTTRALKAAVVRGSYSAVSGTDQAYGTDRAYGTTNRANGTTD
eukprot:3359889-Rhodomonas_salina.1